MKPIQGSLCGVCGERLAHRQTMNPEESDGICDLCRTEAPAYILASAYGSYEGELRELIHLLKYNGVRPAARVLGGKLAEAVKKMRDQMQEPALFEGPAFLVVPVPLHSSKFRERGFNQAELIAREALKHFDRKRFELAPNLLRRQRVTESQIGLTQNQRRENLRRAFAVKSPERVSGREVLLVDDVVTTGTTASECARVLKWAGAGNVWVATVARTFKRSGQIFGDLEEPGAMAG